MSSVITRDPEQPLSVRVFDWMNYYTKSRAFVAPYGACDDERAGGVTRICCGLRYSSACPDRVPKVACNELVQVRRSARSSLRRWDRPQGPRRGPRGRGRRSLAGRQPNYHRSAKQSSYSTRALRGSTRLPGHASVACRRERDGIVLAVRRRVPAVAWRSQDRVGVGAAPGQDLGLPMDDRFSDRVHRLPDLPDDFRFFPLGYLGSRSSMSRSSGSRIGNMASSGPPTEARVGCPLT